MGREIERSTAWRDSSALERWHLPIKSLARTYMWQCVDQALIDCLVPVLWASFPASALASLCVGGEWAERAAGERR